MDKYTYISTKHTHTHTEPSLLKHYFIFSLCLSLPPSFTLPLWHANYTQVSVAAQGSSLWPTVIYSLLKAAVCVWDCWRLMLFCQHSAGLCVCVHVCGFTWVKKKKKGGKYIMHGCRYHQVHWSKLRPEELKLNQAGFSLHCVTCASLIQSSICHVAEINHRVVKRNAAPGRHPEPSLCGFDTPRKSWFSEKKLHPVRRGIEQEGRNKTRSCKFFLPQKKKWHLNLIPVCCWTEPLGMN